MKRNLPPLDLPDFSPKYQPDGSLSSEKSGEMIALAMREGSNYFEWKHKRLDGSEFFATVFLTKMELKGVFIVLATVRDSTERKKRELALQESEHRYRQLFSKIADAIFVADVESKMLVDCNKKAELLTEYSREEILSMRADQLHPEETRSDVMKVFSEQACGNTEEGFESVVVSKTGKTTPVIISAGPVTIGTKQYLIGVF